MYITEVGRVGFSMYDLDLNTYLPLKYLLMGKLYCLLPFVNLDLCQTPGVDAFEIFSML